MEDAIKSLATHLRMKAEKLLKSRPKKQVSHLNEGEILKLLHELEVYSVELELQNEELLNASSDAVEVAGKNKFSQNVKQRIIHEFEVNQIELEMLNEELQLSNVVSKDVAERYADLFNFSSSGYLILSKEGEILDLNFTGARLLRKDRFKLKNSLFGFFVSDDDKSRYNDFLSGIFNTNTKSVCEVTLTSEDSKTIDVQLTGILTQNVEQCLMTVVDISESNQTTKYRNLSREILQILNEPGTIQDSIHRTLSLLKTSTGFEAVGIRMQDGNDFPYLDQMGFSDKFMSSENTLLELDKNGVVRLDKKGHPALACNCGLVLSGELNSEFASVTEGGSWWTNDSSHILDCESNKSICFTPGMQCILQGYSSIALVPIRTNDKIVGLIQFNDYKKGSFNINKIEYLEGIATHIGASLKQKLAEEKLQKNEELLRTIMENAPDIIIQLDQQGTILYMNRTLPGYSMENSIGKNFCEWTLPEYHTFMNQSLEFVFKDSTTQTYLSKGNDKQGNERWYRTNISPVKDSEMVKNAILITRDITESILNEEKINEVEAKRKAIIETAMDGFWIFDRRGCFLEVNDTYCRKSGYSKQELLTMQIQDIEVRENEVDIVTHLQKIIQLGEIRYECRHRRKDGSIMEIGTNIQYRPAEGGQFVAFVHDISKRKKAEDLLQINNSRLKLAMQSGNMAWWEMNIATGNIAFEKRKAEMLGYNPENFTHYTDFMKLVHPDDAKRAMESMSKHIHGSADKYEVEYRILAKSGEYLWFYDIGSVTTRDSNGKSLIATGLVINITERKKTEELLQQSENRFRLALKNSPVSVATQDKNFIYTWAYNYKTQKDDDIIGKTDIDMFAPEDLPAILEVKHRVIEFGTEEHIQTWVNGNNQRVFLDIHYEPVKDTEGVTIGIGIAKVNLTQQKLAEITLHQYITAQETLSVAATELLGTMSYSELLKFAVKQIQQIAGKSIVILSELDTQTEQTIIRAVNGYDQKIDKLEAIIGKSLVGTSFQLVHDIWQHIDMTCLTLIEGGFYDLSFRQLSQNICLEIESKLQIKSSYVMPLSVEDDMMGTVVISVESTNELPNKTLIETFIKQISLALKSKRTKEELSQSRAELDIALANMTDAVFITDAQGQNIHINNAFATFHRFKDPDECKKAFAEDPEMLEVYSIDDISVPSDMRAVSRALNGENASNVEYKLKRKDTGETWVGSYSFAPIRNYENDIVGSVVVARDITESKHAQEELRAKEERYSLIYNSSRDGIFSLDLSGRLTSANRSFCEDFNLDLSQIIASTFEDVGLNKQLCQELENLKKQVLESDNSIIYELSLPLPDGKIRHYELILNPLHDDKLNIVGFGGSSRNITKRKESNQALIESERRFRYLIKDMPVGVILYGSNSEVVMTNPKALELLAINNDQLVGNDSFEFGWDMIHEDGSTFIKSDQPVGQVHETLQSAQDAVIGIIRPDSKDKIWLLKDTEILLKVDGTIRNVVCSLIDITERKEKEEALRKLNMTLAALGKSSQAMSQPLDEIDYLNKVCNIIVEDTNFPMVWIGYAEYDEAKTIRPMASAGFVDNYLDTIKLSWDENEFGRGPTGTAIRTGIMGICNNMATDPAFEPWREEALKRGYASSIVFPLITGDMTFGAITIYSKEPNSFLDDEIKLLNKLASDLAHGITSIRLLTAHQLAEKELIQSHNELEKTVKERTIELQESNEVLKVTEEKYRTVADFATNWEFWIASDDKMIYCSPSCERITGYSVADFVTNPHLIYDIIHPDELEKYEEHRESEKTASKCDHEIQYKIFKKDGSIRWIGHFCRPVYDDSGSFTGTRGSNKDITARKKMEELLVVSNQKYKLLSANINDGIFICKNAQFEYVNNAFYDIFGYTEKELIKMKLTQLVMTDYHEELENFLYTTSSINKSCILEVECLRNDCSIVFVEILLNYVAKDKTVYGVVHDITEKKEFQKNMVKAIIQTEENERSHFSKELHDGLGPLLSTIKLYLQWSERPNSNKSREEIIGKAGEILEEALTTVKEISTKLSPHLLTNYGLSSAIKSFVEKLNATASYIVVFESNSSRRFDGDIETALYRAVIECINNTLKYAKATDIYIHLNDTGSQIQLQYKDNGIGFDITTTIAEHKGLGLFNLQNRLHTIGGKVDLKSEPKKGVDYMFTVNI